MALLSLSRLQEYPSHPESFPSRDLHYLLSQYIHGEHFAVRVAEKILSSCPNSNRSIQIIVEDFLADEKHHVMLLETYLMRNFGSILTHHEGTAKLCAFSLEQDSYLPSTLILHGVIEPFGLGSLMGIRKYVLAEDLGELIDVISQDESRHLNIGQEIILAERGNYPLAGELQTLAFELFKELCESTLAKPVMEELFPLKWEAEIWMERAIRSNFQKRQSRMVLSAVTTQMKKLGFSQEIIASLMTFARNFGLNPFGHVTLRGTRPAPSPRINQTSHPHYDDGNVLFQDILGPTMAYSCANWEGQDNLDSAQMAKYRKIARLSGISEESRSVLDCGCGWGGYIKYLKDQLPNLERIEGVTISQEQSQWFNTNHGGSKAKTHHISIFDFLENADANLRFDAASSIEALEHFANSADFHSGQHRRIYENFFKLVRSRVSGKFGFETIVAVKDIKHMQGDESRNALRFALYMLREVYPNSHLSSPRDIEASSAPFWRLDEAEVLHEDYALTLEAWHKRLDQIRDRYCPKRVARYRRYFEMCIEQFRSGAIGLLQASLLPK